MVHLCDAPAHTAQYSSGCEDDYPFLYRNGQLEDTILQVKNKSNQIKFLAIKLSEYTDEMFKKI